MSQADQERWNARYQQVQSPLGPPGPALTELRHWLPPTGGALDVAGGRGRHALWLAQQGFATTLVDISGVALEQARSEARARGLHLATLQADLDCDPLPQGPWDLIVNVDFLSRALFKHYPGLLRAGGLLLFSQPTERNLERHPRPSRRFLLAEGELGGLIGELEVVHYDEAWRHDGRHSAWLLARRPMQ